MSSDPSQPKKGLSTGAIIGIGCASIIGLVVIGIVIVTVVFGGKFMKFAEEAQKDPTRAMANIMVSAGGMEMVAKDETNKRYTVKDKKSGKLTTIYWDAKKNEAEVIEGDFSAIPAEQPSATPAANPEAIEEKKQP